MDLREKEKYHEIHPAKLVTDIGVAVAMLYFFWLQNLLAGIIVTIPSLIASAVIIRWVDLEKYKQSSFGKYIDRYMTNTMRLTRFAGLIVALFGAWLHVWWLIPAGLMVVVLAWLRGKIFPIRG